MEAVVLAGGLGTRLRSVVSDVPKPMAPVGGKPFLEYILKYLKRNGIEKIVLSVGYKWETIKKYFTDEFDGIELVYSVEDEPLGTGGAIKKALDSVESDKAYIVNGDTFFDIDLQELVLANDSKIVLALKRMYDFDRYGCVESDTEGRVIKFTEKGFRKSGNINGGIYLVNRNLFEPYILNNKFSFEEFMQKEYMNLKMISKVFDNYFIDIGIPGDYDRAQKEIGVHF